MNRMGFRVTLNVLLKQSYSYLMLALALAMRDAVVATCFTQLTALKQTWQSPLKTDKGGFSPPLSQASW